MSFFPFVSRLSTAPLRRMPDVLSLYWMPLRLFLQMSNFALSLKSLYPFSRPYSLISGGSSPFSMNLSKCCFRILSMPAGKLGKAVSGLLIFLTSLSQKHCSHSCMRFRLEGESLYSCSFLGCFGAGLSLGILFYILFSFLYWRRNKIVFYKFSIF